MEISFMKLTEKSFEL